MLLSSTFLNLGRAGRLVSNDDEFSARRSLDFLSSPRVLDRSVLFRLETFSKLVMHISVFFFAASSFLSLVVLLSLGLAVVSETRRVVEQQIELERKQGERFTGVSTFLIPFFFFCNPRTSRTDSSSASRVQLDS